MPDFTPTHSNAQALAYEQALPAAERLRNGQYYTPESVCDLMLALSKPTALSVQSSSAEGPLRVLEPGCGPGSFLTRLIHHLESLPLSAITTRSLELYGIELDQGSANLAKSIIPASGNGYQTEIHTLNFISPEVDNLGLFDWIIGNPPYVRQEHLAQSQQIDKKAMLTYLLSKYQDYLQSYPEQKVLFSHRADLYLWFFLQAATLLKPGGRLAFITSNSWLNTACGKHFQQFLTHHFQILTLVESSCERWFSDAAINPLIVVLEKKQLEHTHSETPILPNSASAHPGQINKGQIGPVQLIRFMRPLKQWLPHPNKADYWAKLERQIQQIPTSPDKAQLQLNMLQIGQLQAPPFEANWALPLRAATELTDLLNIPSLWCKLEDLGQVRYPLKTGINAFFYLSEEKAAHWQIEPEFLFPVLRSSRQVKGYIIQAKDLREYLFSCPYTRQELAEQGKSGALAYILWGETQSAQPRQKRAQPVPWPKVPSIQSNRPWHFTKRLSPAHLLCPRFIDQRFFFPLCQGAVMEDQTFYGLTIKEPTQFPPPLIAALLNSTLSYLLAEFSARTNLGEGVLQYARCDMAAFPVIQPTLYSHTTQHQMIQAFQTLSNRPILPLAQELCSPDRVALDQLILAPLLGALPPAQDARAMQERLTTQLLIRVQERQSLARSVKRKPALK
jgi:methylase of polypeptide subunit release factors